MFGGLFSNWTGQDKEDASNYGDDSFTDAKVRQSGLLDDLKALGPNIGKDAMTLMDKVMTKGEPYDDRTFLVCQRVMPRLNDSSKQQMERLIALIASLPQNSMMRAKLSQAFVGTLWDSLQHPPLSYYGEQHQYRTADGSYNVICSTLSLKNGSSQGWQNILYPDFGKAGMPYAKSVRSVKALHGAKPDPGVLFDCELVSLKKKGT